MNIVKKCLMIFIAMMCMHNPMVAFDWQNIFARVSKPAMSLVKKTSDLIERNPKLSVAALVIVAAVGVYYVANYTHWQNNSTDSDPLAKRPTMVNELPDKDFLASLIKVDELPDMNSRTFKTNDIDDFLRSLQRDIEAFEKVLFNARQVVLEAKHQLLVRNCIERAIMIIPEILARIQNLGQRNKRYDQIEQDYKHNLELSPVLLGNDPRKVVQQFCQKDDLVPQELTLEHYRALIKETQEKRVPDEDLKKAVRQLEYWGSDPFSWQTYTAFLRGKGTYDRLPHATKQELEPLVDKARALKNGYNLLNQQLPKELQVD